MFSSAKYMQLQRNYTCVCFTSEQNVSEYETLIETCMQQHPTGESSDLQCTLKCSETGSGEMCVEASTAQGPGVEEQASVWLLTGRALQLC